MRQHSVNEGLNDLDIARELEELAKLTREDEEIGMILARYTDSKNTGQRLTKSDCLAQASSPAVAEEAAKLLDVVDLLVLFRGKKQGH